LPFTTVSCPFNLEANPIIKINTNWNIFFLTTIIFGLF